MQIILFFDNNCNAGHTSIRNGNKNSRGWLLAEGEEKRPKELYDSVVFGDQKRKSRAGGVFGYFILLLSSGSCGSRITVDQWTYTDQ